MFYKHDGVEESYSCVYVDERIFGVHIIRDINTGEETIYDDPTNSYLSWNLTVSEIEEELYLVWLDRIKQKRITLEAFIFERSVGKELKRRSKEVYKRIWKPDGYFDFEVYHPKRIISAPYYEDRIVEQWLTDRFIKPYVEGKVHPYNVACREDKGPVVARDRILNIIEECYQKYGTDFYFFQFDMQGYYDNLSHDVIKEQFSGMEALGRILLFNIVDDWMMYDCYAYLNDPLHSYGVPKGNLPSQWIGIMYLNDIDWYIAGREDCEGNVRYMDDGIAFFHLKQSCKDCKIKIENILNEKHMGVRLHPKKTVYAPITRGFNFCGWHYGLKKDGTPIRVKVKTERKKLIKKKYEQISEDYYLGNLSWKDVEAKLNGSYAFLKQGDTKQFRRYLSYRYRFTHDEDLYYKDREPSRKKRRKNKDTDKEKGKQNFQGGNDL